MKRKLIQLIAIALISVPVYSQSVNITINPGGPQKQISPYLYGKNNSLSDNSVNSAGNLTAADWQFLRDLGIQFFRENGGNNSTKYNWRRKLSSHPDWYNNVYAHDWNYAAQTLQDHIPSAQGMWAFQLIGKAARTGSANFNDWAYNNSQWWSGCGQNLAGGGVLNPAGGGKAITDGNPALYLEDWNADSTTGILDHWFGQDGIGLDKEKIRYWSMDNEPEIWNGTHDDVWPQQPSAEEFMQMYFQVAKKARAKYPGIKLTGPVPANEWQWYNWNGDKIAYKGKTYVWLEYFIMRIAEEQQASGIRLLDVLDIHFYPGETNPADITQLHRVYFDSTYNYPGANGVKRSGTGSWDNSITREYIFKRCKNWLTKYMGADHGVTFAVTETAIAKKDNPSLTANWYASTMGEFARQGVEIFTPWDWVTGMSEVVHLFSHYGKKIYIPSVSSDEYYVSAYPTMNASGDSITIFLVNRHLTSSRQVDIDISNFYIRDGNYKLYTLSNLPSYETFTSHTANALAQSNVAVQQNNIAFSLPPLSVSALVIAKNTVVYNRYGELQVSSEAESGSLTGVSAASSVPGFSGNGYLTGFDQAGDKVTLNMNVTGSDVYRIVVHYNGIAESTYKLKINNSYTSDVILPQTVSFSSTDAGSFLLNTGSNSITLSYNAGSALIDKIEIYRIEKNEYDISADLIDTEANEETKALYRFLQYQFGDRIISGQTYNYYSQVKTLTGKSPMLRAGDFQHFTQGYPYLWVNGIGHTYGYDAGDGTVNSLINWYNSTGKKGIVSMQWHWHDPLGDSTSNVSTNTFYTDQTSFDIRRAVIPGTPEYNCVIRDIDSIAFQLKKFQKAGVPVLWRPLHEAGGGWFWWGAKGPEACLALWDILIERLKNHHQLHNLIWVWSSPEPGWYPGNDKVDLIGYDSYPGSYNYISQKAMFDNLYSITQGRKLIAMTENGPIPDPDACLQQDAPWLYFMSWNELVMQQNTEDHIKAVYNNPVVLTLESQNAKTGFEWRSSLYPEDWVPGYKDEQGRFLHDFSYAGYHQGESGIPRITSNVIDITQAPYNADNTGNADVTGVIQNALNDAGKAGGGVVYLPAGKYRISAAADSSCALRISYDSTVLRGAGAGLTFLLNDQTVMRNKDSIRVKGADSDWFTPRGISSLIVFDLPEPTRVIPVQSVNGFNKGDAVIVTSLPTEAFIAEHGMSGYWTAAGIKGVAFMRTIDSIDVKNNLLILDAPTRYALKTRDDSKVYLAGRHLRECGIEDLSIGNLENESAGWDEESYLQAGTGAYETHFSHAVHFRNAENCWIKNVATFRDGSNAADIHILSNGIKLNQCRNITVDSCRFEKPQNESGGGNGYMYTLESNDCLISNSIANDGRHNYDFKYPYSNGNVILKCRGENSKYASDFHMYLSMANLFDACTLSADYLESTYRPYGGPMHGYSSTQSVFYNTTGEAYHPDRNYLIESKQFGWGYIIGTSGPADMVSIDPAEGALNGYYYNTTPRDFTEGISEGDFLVPQSLYLDQLARRKNAPANYGNYRVSVIVRDSETQLILPGSLVCIYRDSLITEDAGEAVFDNVPGFFSMTVNKDYYLPMERTQHAIFSDTTFVIFLSRQKYDLSIRLYRDGTLEPIGYTAVQVGPVQQVTTSLGVANFSLDAGPLSYEVSKSGYSTVQGTFTLQSDTTITLFLHKTNANLRIRLRIESVPVNLAQVAVNGDTVLTSSIGDAIFSQLPLDVEYTYSISKDGFKDVSGTVYLTNDTMVVIMMEKATVSDDYMRDDMIRCWPNPVNDMVNIQIAGKINKATVQITDIRGAEVHREDVTSEHIQIPVRQLVPGTYIVRIIKDEKTMTGYFIRNL